MSSISPKKLKHGFSLLGLIQLFLLNVILLVVFFFVDILSLIGFLGLEDGIDLFVAVPLLISTLACIINLWLLKNSWLTFLLSQILFFVSFIVFVLWIVSQILLFLTWG